MNGSNRTGHNLVNINHINNHRQDFCVYFVSFFFMVQNVIYDMDNVFLA